MDSSNKKKIAQMDSPNKQEIAEMDSPSNKKTTEVDSPKKQEIAEVDSPNKQETANMDWKMRQMEIEMNAALEEKQGKIDDLKFQLTMYGRLNKSLKLQLDLQAIQLANHEKLQETLMLKRDNLKNQILKLIKQKNDDQEEMQRILSNGIENFEKILNNAYKLDVDEKGLMQEKLQQLMDETRDLKQELHVKTCYVTPTVREAGATNSMNSLNLLPNGIETNGELENHGDTVDPNATRVSGSLGNGNEHNQQHSLPNSDQIPPQFNALAEMIQRLNAMEAQLKAAEENGPMPPEDRSSQE